MSDNRQRRRRPICLTYKHGNRLTPSYAFRVSLPGAVLGIVDNLIFITSLTAVSSDMALRYMFWAAERMHQKRQA